MTCLSRTAPLPPQTHALPLLGWLTAWQGHFAAARAQRHLATLDDRALCDLGLSRELFDPPRPCDPAGLWLNRVPG